MTLSLMLLAVGLPLADATDTFAELLQHAFYPMLLLVFVIASLGVPIPEDIPLIAAGIILRTHPEIASWPPTLLVSLVGIMSGDVILYSLGRRWGRGVFAHRSVSWLITPHRLDVISARFRKYGVFMVFFGRLFMGIRAAMCLTAGVTRYPFWRFFLADMAGAIVSIPVFIGLGYAFAGMIPTLRSYLFGMQSVLAIALGLVVALVVWYEIRRFRRMRAADAAEQQRLAGLKSETADEPPAAVPASPAGDPAPLTVESAAPAAKRAPAACTPSSV